MVTFSVRAKTKADEEWVLDVVRGWGADFVVTRGRKVFPTELPGFVALSADDSRVGLVTYEIADDECEIVTLDALERRRGIGSALVEEVCTAARAAGCRRLWLITTNDNLDAIRFYQRRGFTLAALHVRAIERSREMKPSIPEIGAYGIPIRDEVELEREL